MKAENPKLTGTAANPDPHGVDQLIERIRAEASRREERHPDLWQPVDELALQNPPQRLSEPRAFVLPEEISDADCAPEQPFRAKSLPRFSDASFVRHAFQRVLGRPPEPDALASYTRFLHDGGSEYALLAELMLSDEGRARGVWFKGLALALFRQRLCRRLGLLGRLVLRVTMPIDRLLISFHRRKVTVSDFHYLWNLLAESQTRQLNALDAHQRQVNYDMRVFIDKFVDSVTINFQQMQRRLVQQLDILQRLTREHQDIMRALEVATPSIDTLKTQVEALETEVFDKSAREIARFKESAQEFERHALTLRQDWNAQRRGFEKFIGDMRQALRPNEEETRAEVNTEAAAKTLSAHEGDVLDAFYVAFEEACRGPRDEIKRELRHYLPYFDKLSALPKLRDAPVVDLGCGRGEWLELLGEHGWNTVGVDLSPIMIDVCAEYGLETKRLDALEYLRQQDDASLAAVTGFHIIEHLPFDVLFELISESTRVLKSGGLVLFETPNPENVLVGSHTFYHDFTHRNPITPTAIDFLARYHGFASSQIIRSHPYPESARVPGDDPLTERVNGHLCGPQDFAIIAWKPLIDVRGRLQ